MLDDVTSASDERAIRALVETWMSATNAGHLATVVERMTDDVLFLTPGRAPVRRSGCTLTVLKKGDDGH